MSINFQSIKNNKYTKFFISVIILIIAMLIIFSTPYINLLIIIFGEFGAIIFALSFFIWSILLTILFLLVLEWFFNLNDKFLYKNNGDYQYDLHYWLAEDRVSNKFLKSLLSEDASEDKNEISNLIRVKEILEEKLKNDVINYKIFRTFLINRTKKGLLKKISSFIVTTFVALGIKSQLSNIKSYLQGKIDNEKFIEILSSLITIEGYSKLIIVLSFFFILYFLVYRLLLRLTEDGRRINNIISILDNLIEGK